MKKFISLALTGFFTVGMLSLFTGCGGGKDANTFSWWIPTGDSTYYADYKDNPVLDYISKFKQFKNSEGELTNIKFEFEIPSDSGSAITDFNNMIANREFEDIMNPGQYEGTIADLYEYGAIIDLTPYATDPNVMPNLSAWLEGNPELAPYAYTTCSDGKQRILAFPAIMDALDREEQAFGFNYRRDLLVKFGTQPAQFFDPMQDEAPVANPDAGKPFSGSFTMNADGSAREQASSQNTSLPQGADGHSWVDNVRFPSGNTDPVYISDWQWMFETFEKAYESLGIDNYMMSIYYPGYIANGDLVSGFSGGGVYWYKTAENEAAFGATETGFRAYLECMRNWYNKGWLDNNFNTKKDVFYAIDNAKIGEGDVAVWMGNATRLGTLMATESGHAAGAIVYGAAMPINDIPAYDGVTSTSDYSKQATAAEAQAAMSGGTGSDYMLQIPTCLFQNEQMSGAAVISKEAAEKRDLTLLLNFFDYLYSEEGSLLTTMGLSKEQYEESQNEIYTEYGLTDGAYTVNEDGTYSYVPVLQENALGIRSALGGTRVTMLRCVSKIKYNFPQTYLNSREQWVKYKATGFIGGMIGGSLTPDEMEKVQNVRLPLEENYLFKNVYQFIKGGKSLDNDWASFCSGIMNYRNKNTKVADVTAAYNAAFDRLYGN